jgi:hypothetical protein
MIVDLWFADTKLVRNPLLGSQRGSEWIVGDAEVVQVSGDLPELFVVMQHKSSSHSPNDRFVIALHSPDGNLQTGPPGSPPEKRAAELAFWVQQDTLSESGLSAKYAKLRGFPAILTGKAQSFSAVETCWRRELDSNSEYRFQLWRKLPRVSDLPGFHLRNERSGETN